jgi:hypothetical protein
MEDKEKRKAEVRARMEEEAASKKKKGGFMTPARKQKLRKMIREMAAIELKLEQERKAEEKKKAILERCGAPKDIASLNEAELMQICKTYHTRTGELEGDKYDLEYATAKKDYTIREITEKVNFRPGKYAKPKLKKVSKTGQQLEKILAFTAKISLQNSRADKLKIASIEEKKEPEKEKAAE